MSRIYNFSAGPAVLPEAVLAQAKADLDNWQNCGISVMEMSHRGAEFKQIAAEAEADLRELMGISDDYAVLFLQGGASSQFSAIPLNFLNGKTKADYVNTGSWSKKAIAEAKKFCDVNIAATSEADKFTSIPDESTWSLSDDAAYLHYTPNETIGGVEFHFIPDSKGKPLVADMSSTILSRPIDVSKFDLIYAGAQKNIGPAGLTIVIVKKSLLGNAAESTPAMMNYQNAADNDSMYNTPPTFAWYMAGLVFKHVKSLGGLSAMAEINQRKANKLYDAIDSSNFYSNPVAKDARSWMNIPFVLANSDLDAEFLSGAKEQGLVQLKGHRSVGGMRASIYNAMPEEGVDKLIAYMAEFEKKHG